MLPILAVLPFASLVAAYSFNIASTPRQCQDLTFSITGEGQPPYSLLIIPSGPTPLPNAIEARKITNVPFNDSNTSVTFQLKYPENSQFVAVVSDKSGFGSGGTSAAVTVLSGDNGCFDPSTQVSPAWLFHTDPDGAVTSCLTSRIWWNDGDPQGTPRFQGVIPGGQSFEIPVGATSTKSGEGIGFNWIPSVRIGTTLLLVAGDNRGLGSAGSNVYTIQQGNSFSCLNDTSPSSTPGSPAGGSYPTSTDGSGTNPNSSSGGGSHTNIGAIVGGVIGGVVGVVAIALVLLFVMRRRRFHKSAKERPVDLLNEQDGENGRGDGELPAYYQPRPFTLPEPTVASTRPSAEPEDRPAGASQRHSYLSSSTEPGDNSGNLGAGTSATSRKSERPPQARAVNVIQHDDAGPPPPPETIELPPAYTNIKRDPAAADADASTAPTATAPS